MSLVDRQSRPCRGDTLLTVCISLRTGSVPQGHPGKRYSLFYFATLSIHLTIVSITTIEMPHRITKTIQQFHIGYLL